MDIIRFGLDLAKNSFALCGVEAHGKIAVKNLKREQLLEFFANAPAALIAMEAGSGAHDWARELTGLGHDARIIDPRLVAPYCQSGRAGKNDFNDAVAICEATGRPQMRFIPVKSKDQQAILLVHRLRQACVAEHTRLVNRLRGFLAEFGIVVPKGANTFKNRWPIIRHSAAARSRPAGPRLGDARRALWQARRASPAGAGLRPADQCLRPSGRTCQAPDRAHQPAAIAASVR